MNRNHKVAWSRTRERVFWAGMSPQPPTSSPHRGHGQRTRASPLQSSLPGPKALLRRCCNSGRGSKYSWTPKPTTSVNTSLRSLHVQTSQHGACHLVLAALGSFLPGSSLLHAQSPPASVSDPSSDLKILSHGVLSLLSLA